MLCKGRTFTYYGKGFEDIIYNTLVEDSWLFVELDCNENVGYLKLFLFLTNTVICFIYIYIYIKINKHCLIVAFVAL